MSANKAGAHTPDVGYVVIAEWPEGPQVWRAGVFDSEEEARAMFESDGNGGTFIRVVPVNACEGIADPSCVPELLAALREAALEMRVAALNLASFGAPKLADELNAKADALMRRTFL